jgi:cobalt-zinc-cadmium resistance protein CzcA
LAETTLLTKPVHKTDNLNVEQLLRLSVKARLFAFVLAALLAVWGYISYSNLTIEAFPDPTDTQVQVITLFAGQPTEEVERRVSMLSLHAR